MIFLWGMLIASGWWGIGLMSYNGMEKSEGFAPLAVLLFALNFATFFYIFVKVGLCMTKFWDD